MNSNLPSLTLTLIRVRPKDGECTYRLEGLNGSVYATKAMFAGDPPQTLTLTGDGLADPAAVAAAKETRKAERDAKRAARVAELQAQLTAAAERAAAAEAALAALQAKACQGPHQGRVKDGTPRRGSADLRLVVRCSFTTRYRGLHSNGGRAHRCGPRSLLLSVPMCPRAVML